MRISWRVDMSNVLFLVAVILGIICLVIPSSARGMGFPDAENNYSSYDVRVVKGFCPGTNTVFVDSFSDDRNVLGRYLGYAVIFEANKPPRIVENVLVIAVKGIVESPFEVQISDVLQHECVHHQQRLRYESYFAFHKAYQTLHRAFEEEAYARGSALSVFTVASIGKPKEVIPATMVFQ